MVAYTPPQENDLLQGKDLVFCNNFLAIKATLLLAKPSQVPLLEFPDRLEVGTWGSGFWCSQVHLFKKKKMHDVQMATVSI